MAGRLGGPEKACVVRRPWLQVALALAAAAVLALVLMRLPVHCGAWTEIRLGPEARPSEFGTCRYQEIEIPLVHPSEPDRIRVGEGGGTMDYATFHVYRRDRDGGDRIVLRFAGNADAFWSPRMWVEERADGRPRRILTYHQYLVNTDIGEDLPGGYWLWTWDGTCYRPART